MRGCYMILAFPKIAFLKYTNKKKLSKKIFFPGNNKKKNPYHGTKLLIMVLNLTEKFF